MNKWVSTSIAFFEKHVASFNNLTEDQKKNFKIKQRHSYRVARNCKDIATKLEWVTTDVELAYICGLLHDTGRFEQLIKYGTFHDKKSIDHANLAVDILKQNRVLDELPFDEQQLVLTAIKYHNKFEVSKELGTNQRLFCNLLRDADKLDILAILTEYYTNPSKEANHTLTWELPAGKDVSKQVAEQAINGQLVSKSIIKNQIDVKVLQITWVYDLNFSPSFEYLIKKKILEKIYSSLFKNNTINEIYQLAKKYAESKVMSYAKNNKG